MIWVIVAVFWIATMVLAALYPLTRDAKQAGDLVELCAYFGVATIVISTVAVFTWKVV